MGFTNVVWESRSAEQLARDLTDGPGPGSVGEAGAAWVRVANELARVSTDFDVIVERFKASWDSGGSDAVSQKLVEFGRWIQSLALNAAGNGQKIEEAAVANTVAILSMPSVSDVVEAKASADMMASLGAYNGAILDGKFAELEEAATAQQADAAAVMIRYEEAVAEFAEPWEQLPPPQVVKGDALKAEKEGKSEGKGGGGRGGGGGGGTARPLAPMAASPIKNSEAAKDLKKTPFGSGAGSSSGGMGRGAMGPMGMMGRGGSQDREHESIRPAESLEGGGEPGARLSEVSGSSWLPAAQQSDAPFTVANVSWGPNTAIFDELATPEPTAESFAEEPARTLQQVSDRWVAPPVIGADDKDPVR
ncbi:PPE domain-containing protein [Mycobacteroides salmoniphilum]|uniref:PPE domain-containing protein n=1 Tax=Mycobacteroides salmoniphilum TaxID=404941 RepID=UPI0009924174|nr:PPE domain-containing protein [Mycobacteroides salmoniphilum]QCH25769.1 PPE family protein [Mycobacteroides salmoniphilum]